MNINLYKKIVIYYNTPKFLIQYQKQLFCSFETIATFLSVQSFFIWFIVFVIFKTINNCIEIIDFRIALTFT